MSEWDFLLWLRSVSSRDYSDGSFSCRQWFSDTRDQYSAEKSRKTANLWSLLCTHSPFWYSANSSPLGLVGLPVSSSFRAIAELCLDSPSLHCNLETLSRNYAGAITGLTLFVSWDSLCIKIHYDHMADRIMAPWNGHVLKPQNLWILFTCERGFVNVIKLI